MIVGGAILFLALYASWHISEGEREVQQTFTAQELITQLSTLTTSLETTNRPGNLSFATPVRITPRCTLEGNWGKQEVNVAQRSGIGKPWEDTGIPAAASTLYLFSATPAEGRTFTLLVKPILLPFKIGDSIALWSGSYCFVQPSGAVEDDLSLLEGTGNPITSVSHAKECPRNSTVVCFTSGSLPGSKSSCQVIVDLTQQSVTKQGRTFHYIDSLLYAAIFGEANVYECNVMRLLRRAEFLATLYSDKSSFIASRSHTGCSSNIQEELASYRALAHNGTSAVLPALWIKAQELDKRNPDACPLWKEKLR